MTLLTQDHLEQIHQAVKKQYGRHHESKLIVCYYDSLCFFLIALPARSVKK